MLPLSFPFLHRLSTSSHQRSSRDRRHGSYTKPHTVIHPRVGSLPHTPSTEINRRLALPPYILGVKRGRYSLLLIFGSYENRITLILVMKMKRDFIMSPAIRISHLPDGHSCIFDHHFDIRNRPPVALADKPFDDESMIHLMLGDRYRRHQDRPRHNPDARIPKDSCPNSAVFSPAYPGQQSRRRVNSSM